MFSLQFYPMSWGTCEDQSMAQSWESVRSSAISAVISGASAACLGLIISWPEVKLAKPWNSGTFCTSVSYMCNNYRKTCLKRPLKNRQNKGLKDKCYLNEGQKYCRMLSWSILQYFWPALSDNWSWKPIFGLLFGWSLKTGFTVVVFLPASVQTERGCIQMLVHLSITSVINNFHK